MSSLTTGQRWLAAVIAAIAVADTPLFFIVMFSTVNGLLGSSFDGWAWTVPVATEASFTLLYLLELLLEWLARPRRVLRAAPYLFAAASLALNVLGAHGQVPAVVGHAAVTLAFFVPLLVIKAAIRALLVPAEIQARGQALSDARAYAHDILRSALGLFWRWRAPVLLRRQLRSGRLPAAVMTAVESCDAARWERSVETWIMAAVVLPERFRTVLAAARAEVSQGAPASASQSVLAGTSGGTGSAPAGAPADASGTAPGNAPQGAPESTPAVRGVTPGRASGGASGRHARLVPSKATNEELADLVVPMLAKGEQVSKYRVIEAVREAAGGKGKPSIGDQRAGDVLALARERAGATVLQLDSRKHA